MIKDIYGYASGGNHLQEVSNALRGLKGASKDLRRLLDNDGLLTGAARESAQDLLRLSDEAIQEVTSLLSTAKRSAANHAAGR